MALKLVVTTNVDGDVFELVLKNHRYSVGRRHDNDLRVKETYISGYHAEIVRREDGEYCVADLGSSNGTFLNGRRLASKEAIRAGDFIKFGILKVAVLEHVDTVPKIVSLKERPAFAKKDSSNTASIAVEKSTGTVATIVAPPPSPVTGPGPSQDTQAAASLAKELAGLKERLKCESAAASEARGDLVAAKERAASLEESLADTRGRLESREMELAALASAKEKAAALEATLRSHEEELSGLKAERAALAKESTARKSLDATLAERETELSESRRRLDALSEELARHTRDAATREKELTTLREALSGTERSSKELLDARTRELEELARNHEARNLELASLRAALAKAEATARAEREAAASDLEAKSRELESLAAELASLARERDLLRDNLESKEGALAASADEIAKLAALSATIATLESRLSAARAEAEKGRVGQETLSASLKEREAQWQVEQKARTTAAKELERERTKLEKSLAFLEGKLAKQSEELAAQKQKALDREKELRAGVAASESRFEAVASEKRHAEEEAERLAGKLAALRESSAETEAEATTISAERDSLRTQFAAAAADRDELKAAVKQQVHDLQTAKAEANELRMELHKTREASESVVRELETTLRSRVAELETSLASERVRATDTASEKSTLEKTLATLRTELETLREEGAQLRLRQEESAKTQGRLQAGLNREATERASAAEALDASRARVNELVTEVESFKLALEAKDREIAEREQQFSRSESETMQRLKRELSESAALHETAEEKAARAAKEKQTLSGAFERLKEQFDQAESALRAAKATEEEAAHARGLLARRLEKAEASNSELAARIKEEAQAALAHKSLIEKLELQIRENESEAVRREREQVHALQADLSRASRRSAEDERRRRELEAELARVTEARCQAEERILSLESRLVEQETETHSTRGLLDQTERARLDLASRLAGETALVATHLGTIDGLRRELSETIARFTRSQSEWIARHGEETDALLAELRAERTRREGLEVDLRNTREGLSGALHHAREDSVRMQAKLLAESHEKLSAIEEELGASIRAREAVEAAKNQLEDELNLREEEIERLSERLEDLGLQLQDEAAARQAVLRHLATTRAGFSETLRSNWKRLAEAGEQFAHESARRRETESLLAEARTAIENLSHELECERSRHSASIREWEDRYEVLRGEKLTLASEDADLRKIREEILASRETKRALEGEIAKLGGEVKTTEGRQAELRLQREHLLAEREELKAALNAARLELGSLQKRCAESKGEEAKQVETIAAAERRIQSLRRLEAEIELAVERRRQQALLTRGEVFSSGSDPVTARPEFSQEDFYRKLIAKLDLIDDLAKRYENKWLYPKVAEQLGILKRGFIEFLHDHSVKPFDLEPGTVLSLAERRRIKLVPLPEGAARKTNGNGANANGSRVVETIRPGYVFQNGSQDVIIRKAEVLVS